VAVGILEDIGSGSSRGIQQQRAKQREETDVYWDGIRQQLKSNIKALEEMLEGSLGVEKS
jgi:hypothetical protein